MNLFTSTHGFYEPEKDEGGVFAWARKSFGLRRTGPGRYAALHLCYNGEDGRLSLRSDAQRVETASLHRGWQYVCFDVAGAEGEELRFELDRVIPVAGDNRELGVAVRSLSFLDDGGVVIRLREAVDNERLNNQEYLAGKTVLESFPPRLRITLETRCNIKPPCIYCEWDHMKRIEGECGISFAPEHLALLGEFYHKARYVADYSHGDPLMHPEIGRIIAGLSAEFKHLEITCNGQLLDERRRRDMLARDLWVYISADSATAAGYNRYRSAQFDVLLANVRALCAERRSRGGLPRVYFAFIMMRSNVAELSAFLELARDIGADGVKVRGLRCDAHISQRKAIRNGFEFDYDAEILAPGELMRHAGKARALAQKLGLTFFVDFEFGSQPAESSAPLCSEPWQAMYVLNRGIRPCGFAKEPIAAWSEQGDRSLPRFLREVFNGPRYREIRKALAARTFPDFCLQCKSCPIVRRSAPGA